MWQLMTYGYADQYKFCYVVDSGSTISILPLKFVNKFHTKIKSIVPINISQAKTLSNI